MIEQPITMTDESVSAIFAGRKTQTRRAIEPQPDWDKEDVTTARITGILAFPIGKVYGQQNGPPIFVNGFKDGIYGIVNNYPVSSHAWVKETFALIECGGKRGIAYRTDGIIDLDRGERWLSPLFMARYHSRLTLEITDVRVERVQAISEADCIAEGVERDRSGFKCYRRILEGPHTGHAHPYNVIPNKSAIISYQEMWDAINGKRKGGAYAWAKDPWVFAYTFRRL
jgi:hypothetical protein